MARLSRNKQLDLLTRRTTRLRDLHQQRAQLDRTIKAETRTVVSQGHSLGLNNADISRLIGVTPEAIRLVAEDIGSENPRGLKRRRKTPEPARSEEAA